MSRGRMAVRFVVAAVALLAAACVPVAPTPPPPQPAPPPPPPAPLLDRTTLVTGLDKPWDIAFVPGATTSAGSMLYTENDAGTVSLYVGPSEQRRVLIALPGVDNAGEGGAMGLAVDPDFSNNHYVYVCYTTSTDNRVSRFVVTSFDGNGRPAAIGFDTDIVPGMHEANFHDGCRIRFDPSTGTANPALFVTMGDAATGPDPQDDDGLNGKVLRVQRDGQMYPGNASGKPWYTKGHRNPQGIAFRPLDGVPYSAEHGPAVDDEINRLTNGGNAGWNPTNGIDYDQSKPMTDHNLGADVFDPVWASGSSTIALSGIDFLQGSTWGSWAGNIVGAVLKNHELRMFTLDAAGTQVTSTTKLFDDGTRLRVPVLGPDGALYVPTDVATPGGQIWRFTKH